METIALTLNNFKNKFYKNVFGSVIEKSYGIAYTNKSFFETDNYLKLNIIFLENIYLLNLNENDTRNVILGNYKYIAEKRKFDKLKNLEKMENDIYQSNTIVNNIKQDNWNSIQW